MVMIMIIMMIIIIRIMMIIMTVMMIDYNDVSQLKTVWLDSLSFLAIRKIDRYSPSDLLGWQMFSCFCRGDDKDRDDCDDRHHLP